jgi:hypothetical protein
MFLVNCIGEPWFRKTLIDDWTVPHKSNGEIISVQRPLIYSQIIPSPSPQDRDGLGISHILGVPSGSYEKRYSSTVKDCIIAKYSFLNLFFRCHSIVLDHLEWQSWPPRISQKYSDFIIQVVLGWTPPKRLVEAWWLQSSTPIQSLQASPESVQECWISCHLNDPNF